MKCPQGLHDRGSVTHSVVRRVRERHIQHEGGTNMKSVHYVGMDVDKEKIVLARLGSGRSAEVQEHVIAKRAALASVFIGNSARWEWR